jgi:hypothetical protein
MYGNAVRHFHVTLGHEPIVQSTDMDAVHFGLAKVLPEPFGVALAINAALAIRIVALAQYGQVTKACSSVPRLLRDMAPKRPRPWKNASRDVSDAACFPV